MKQRFLKPSEIELANSLYIEGATSPTKATFVQMKTITSWAASFEFTEEGPLCNICGKIGGFHHHDMLKRAARAEKAK